MAAEHHESPVAVVTGASRGLGRGVAIALGHAGFTVYCTGRSNTVTTSEWPGTLQETANAVDDAGGRGVAVTVDHLDDAQTKTLFDQVSSESGRLDLLVNNAFGMRDVAIKDSPFWERPLSYWQDMIDVGLRSSYVASTFAAPLMTQRRSGLIVNTSGPGAKIYRHSLPYGVGKAGQDKLAHDMAHDLLPFNVSAISVWPGLIKTERTMYNVNQGAVGGHAGTFSHMETPHFLGRILARLYNAPDLLKLTGGTYYTAELAGRYGVTDMDGTQPESRRALFGEPIFGPVNP